MDGGRKAITLVGEKEEAEAFFYPLPTRSGLRRPSFPPSPRYDRLTSNTTLPLQACLVQRFALYSVCSSFDKIT